jgi:hypothetical protein
VGATATALSIMNLLTDKVNSQIRHINPVKREGGILCLEYWVGYRESQFLITYNTISVSVEKQTTNFQPVNCSELAIRFATFSLYLMSRQEF